MNFNINFQIKQIRYIYNTIAYFVALITTLIAFYDHFIHPFFLISASISFSYTMVYFLKMLIIKNVNTNRNKWVLTCMFYTACFIVYNLSQLYWVEVITTCAILTFLIIVFTIVSLCLKKLTGLS